MNEEVNEEEIERIREKIKEIYQGSIISMWKDDEDVFLEIGKGKMFTQYRVPIEKKEELERELIKLVLEMNEEKTRKMMTDRNRERGYR